MRDRIFKRTQVMLQQFIRFNEFLSFTPTSVDFVINELCVHVVTMMDCVVLVELGFTSRTTKQLNENHHI